MPIYGTAERQRPINVLTGQVQSSRKAPVR